MTWLFDVNVLIAIADSGHVFHRSIHHWLETRSKQTWASCAITENGMVRVLSQSSYKGGARTPAEAVELLRAMKAARSWKHVFWADDLSITDRGTPGTILPDRIGGARQITDVCLAALAMRNQGRLVSFDTSIAWHAVRGAKADLVEIPGYVT